MTGKGTMASQDGFSPTTVCSSTGSRWHTHLNWMRMAGIGSYRYDPITRMRNPLVLALPLLDRGLRLPSLFKILRASRRGSGEGEDGHRNG